MQAKSETIVKVGLCISPIVFGLASLQLGKSAGYDFQVYHYFNGFSFITDRTALDILPAGRQSFLNPVADGLYYVLIENVPARLAGFILAALHTANLILAAAIATCVLAMPRVGPFAFVPPALAAAGFL